jgi:Ser/Thr protein kinase RdoA (MazF antagonist)
MTRDPAVPDSAVLEAFDLAAAPVERAQSGLINNTYYVRSRAGTPLVLQRVHPIFPADVNADIDAVTRHLAGKGLPTPRIVPSTSGALWFEHDGVWRVLTRVEGTSRDALATPAQAREAGHVLGQFHRAVSDLDHTFKNARLGVHDTARHVTNLRTALDECGGHRDIAAIRPLAERALSAAAALSPLPRAADRIVHGDPKISNVMFTAGMERGLCLIDLDTLARMPVALELGDALRSWCNPATEDAPESRFVREFFAAALAGYASAARGLLHCDEWRAIPEATLAITLELGVRFCTDALRESYFRWDASRYASSSEHNRARTLSQLRVAETLKAELPKLGEITKRVFDP